ncbi:hypothetical protein [Sphingobacterium griseoflavum]|uniref:Uncharacterized protein n=1 Tax=Sphingobacterium griseoflavum TaxID=1474952 RepID=A0ABQ3HUY9_9SPHI|nr:hypothetical protein [Sphingobacterium griseoflavum]GHE37241.1 hypothetical protein GCM10017764_20580 [Sphingobacterium griseoflavum]
MNNEQFDKLFKQEMTDFEVDPGADMWAKIEAELPAERKTVSIWKKSGLRYAAALLLLGGLAAMIFRQQIEAPPAREQLVKVREQPDQTEKTEQQVEVSEKGKENTLTQHARIIKANKSPHKEREAAIVKVPGLANKEAKSKLDLYIPDLHIAKIEAVQADTIPPALVNTQVVEIDPIQPLVESPDEEESMLASGSKGNAKTQQGLVTGILNRISDMVNPDQNKTIHFSNDEEGSLRIDILQSFVKNRKKNRR